MPGVVGTVRVVFSDCEAPAPNAKVLNPARLVPAAEVDEEVIRTSVVLVEFAAAVPWFRMSQFTDSEPPATTLDEPSAMFSGIRSEVAGGGGGGGGGGGLLVTLKPSTSINVRSTDVSVDPAMLSSKGSFGVRLLAGEFRKSLGSLLTPKSASLVTPPSIEK